MYPVSPSPTVVVTAHTLADTGNTSALVVAFMVLCLAAAIGLFAVAIANLRGVYLPEWWDRVLKHLGIRSEA